MAAIAGSKPNSSSRVVQDTGDSQLPIAKADAMRQRALVFCAMLFVGALFVADVTSVKMFSFQILNYTVLLPAGTLAFAVTFLASDVACELGGVRFAAGVVWGAIALRLLAALYYHCVVGDLDGHLWVLSKSPTWTVAQQSSVSFVIGGTVPIVLGGFFSASIAFVNDIYLFAFLRERHQGKNLFWLRNGVSTMLSQIINSIVFISLAFGGSLTVAQVLSAIAGQACCKVALAWLDTPLAYLLRNYGKGKPGWFAIWTRAFWRG
jgi:queuosine precursor transporter